MENYEGYVVRSIPNTTTEPVMLPYVCDYCGENMPKEHFSVTGKHIVYSWACSHTCAELLIMRASNPKVKG